MSTGELDIVTSAKVEADRNSNISRLQQVDLGMALDYCKHEIIYQFSVNFSSQNTFR